MATYDLDRTELNHLLTPNIDPSVRTAVLDYLFNDIDSHPTIKIGATPIPTIMIGATN